MISTTIPFAPARVPGSGSVVARPHACVTALPFLLAPVAGVQGTGVPMAGTKLRGTAVAVLGFQAAPTSQHDPIYAPNDGTTPLGIHPPGRPES